MLTNSLLWNVRHPRHYLPEDYHVYLAQDGTSEILGPGWESDQNFLMSLLDPFGWFFKKRQKQKAFWQDNGYANGANGQERNANEQETAYGVTEQTQLTEIGNRQGV
jgi:hypothetical protein